MNNHHFLKDAMLIFFTLEEISEGLLFDPRDIKRFNEVDGYAMMFVQHGQYGKAFDEKKALKQFQDAMTWRKQNNVYGRHVFLPAIYQLTFLSFRRLNE